MTKFSPLSLTKMEEFTYGSDEKISLDPAAIFPFYLCWEKGERLVKNDFYNSEPFQ